MSNLAMIAAQEWARAHASQSDDPVEFGNKVALAYCSAQKTQYTGIPKAPDPLVASFPSRHEIAESMRQAMGVKPSKSDPAAPEPSTQDKPKKPLSPDDSAAFASVFTAAITGRGDPMDRGVTLGDLVRAGLIDPTTIGIAKAPLPATSPATAVQPTSSASSLAKTAEPGCSSPDGQEERRG